MSATSSNYDSHTSVGMYVPSVGTTHLVANKAVVTSISQLAGINFSKAVIKAATGVNSYAVTGMLSTDIIIGAVAMHFSDGGLLSAAVATTSNSGKTGSVAITAGVTSGGIVILDWLDVSV